MEREIKYLASSDFSATCKRLVENRNGAFESQKQKFHIFNKVEKDGLPINSVFNEFWTQIKAEITEGDKAVICQGWQSRNGNKGCMAYILDETGVRISFSARWYWKEMKTKSSFSKENYRAGEGKTKELVYSGIKANFMRK